MVKCGLFLCPARGRLPVGVLVSAYSTEDHTFRRLLREAHNAGRSAKRVSPHVPTALITQDLSLAERGAFDFAVPVRPDLLVRGAAREAGYQPQWFTRLYYYASSPFNLTVAIDSNAGFCGPVEPLLAVARSWDFAVPSQARDCVNHWPHNFMMVFAQTARTEVLFSHWLLAQLQLGVPVDDQQTLFVALHHAIKHAGLRVGRVLGGAALSLLTLDTRFFRSFLPSVTPLIVGPVTLVHPFSITGLDSCANWALGPDVTARPHLFVATRDASSSQHAITLTAATNATHCEHLANRSCVLDCGSPGYARYVGGALERWPHGWDFERLGTTELLAPFLLSKRRAHPAQDVRPPENHKETMLAPFLVSKRRAQPAQGVRPPEGHKETKQSVWTFPVLALLPALLCVVMRHARASHQGFAPL